jgi:protein SCO1/2
MKNCQTTTPGLALAFVLLGSLAAAPVPALGHGTQAHAGLPLAGTAAHYTRTLRAYQVPDVQLTDYDDKPVALRTLLAGNDPVMLNFVFTTCSTVCPVTTKVLSDVPALLGREASRLRLVSISIDPENDTPLQLKAYARSFQAGERWKFLTGRAPDIRQVQLAFDSASADKTGHQPVTLMRQAPGQPWIRIDGFATPQELVLEYRKPLQP